VIALGWLGAWLLAKRRGQPERGDFTDSVMFVGFSFGILLALLQVFATQHFSDARSQAQSEATTLAAMYGDMGVFPPPVRVTARHELVCYMRSVVDQDWRAQERGSGIQSPDTVVRGDRLLALRNTLPTNTPREQAAYGRITQQIGDAGAAREQLLYLASPQVPTVLWVLVFVTAAALIFLIVSEFRSRAKLIQRAVLVAVVLVLTFEVGSMTVLDHPFGPVARVQPTALRHALELLAEGRQGAADFSSCGPLETFRS
jgi:hypothetical protein